MQLQPVRSCWFQRTRSLLHCVRFLSHAGANDPDAIVFRPKRALLLGKVTRYDFERALVNGANEEQTRAALKRKGVNVDSLWVRHQVHHQKLLEVQDILRERGLDVQVVDRLGYTADAVSWADVVFTAGGDGTFLLGAHKINSRDKLIIGLNTDPDFSAGCLCLPKWCTWNFPKALDLLYSGRFRLFWRNRIRVVLIHDKQHVPGLQVLDKRKPVPLNGWQRLQEGSEPMDSGGFGAIPGSDRDSLIPPGLRGFMTQTTLPVRALNEVYVGSALTARVAQYDISIDGEKYVRQKSSGVTIATGTGSTSWYYQINRLSPETIADLLAIAQRMVAREEQANLSMAVRGYSLRNPPGSVQSAAVDSNAVRNVDELKGDIQALAHKISEQYNASIPIPPEDLRMAYVVRDPICNAVFNVSKPRGFATQLQIRPTILDAHIVFDGGWSLPLDYGSVVEMSVAPEDALCCICPLDPS